MNTYIAFYAGKQTEIKADSQWSAVQQAYRELSVPKSKQGLLAVVLAEKNGEPVTHSPGAL